MTKFIIVSAFSFRYKINRCPTTSTASFGSRTSLGLIAIRLNLKPHSVRQPLASARSSAVINPPLPNASTNFSISPHLPSGSAITTNTSSPPTANTNPSWNTSMPTPAPGSPIQKTHSPSDQITEYTKSITLKTLQNSPNPLTSMLY